MWPVWGGQKVLGQPFLSHMLALYYTWMLRGRLEKVPPKERPKDAGKLVQALALITAITLGVDPNPCCRRVCEQGLRPILHCGL